MIVIETYVDKRIIRSQKAIKSAFLHCLAKKPFHEITISEIVRLAEYNRSTFYAHFESTEHLVQSIIDEALQQMIVHIRAPYEHMKEVDMRQLDANAITVFDYFLQNETLFKTLLSNHLQVDIRYKIASAIEQLFIEQYEYELSTKDVDVKWLYIYRAHGLSGMIIRWIEEDFATPAHVMAEQVLKLMTVTTYKFTVTE